MKKFDKDGDGKLSEEEKAELRKAIAQRGRPGGRRPPPELMKKFDKDGDGKLSESERAELRKTMEERRKEFLAKFDKDGDGKLNEEERKAAMAAARNQAKANPPENRMVPVEKKAKGKKEGGKKKKKVAASPPKFPPKSNRSHPARFFERASLGGSFFDFFEK